MSRKERAIAGLLLVVAVVGGAVMPRLLASPATPLGIALGPSPGPSVVQAPTIRKAPRRVVSQRATSQLPEGVEVSSAPVASAAVQPTPAASAARPDQVPAPSPAPPATTAPPSPAPLPAPPPGQLPAAIAHRPPASSMAPGHAKTPPGHAKTPLRHAETPPGRAKTPPGHTKIRREHAKTWRVPGPLPSADPGTGPGRRKGGGNLPGSGHGAVKQVPSHPVGRHHRGVGHLAPPSAGAAASAPGGSPQARPKARGPRGKGSEPPPQVAHGHGHNGNGKGRGD
jgi:translation initiation factor IF-2